MRKLAAVGSQAHDPGLSCEKISGYEKLATPCDYILQLLHRCVFYNHSRTKYGCELEPDGESYQSTRVQC